MDTEQIKKIIRYGFSGFTVLGCNIFLIYFLTDVLGIWYVTSAIFAFIVAFLVSFTLQKLWTFKNRELNRIPNQLLYFFIFSICGLCFNTATLYLLVDKLEIYYLIAQLLAISVIAIVNFFAYSYIFKNSEGA